MAGTKSRSENPVFRARQQLGLTLAGASREAGCHLQAFFLQEQGVYPDILPAIAAWLVKWCQVDLDMVILDYHWFQLRKRQENGEWHGLAVLELGPPDANPMVELRGQLQLSRMGFAKQFCIHPGLLYRVEQGISKTLPGQIRTALLDAGLSKLMVQELTDRIEELA